MNFGGISEMVADQKAAFSQRLARISAGQQFEHPEIIGAHTQQAYDRIYGDKAKKPRRTFAEKMMVLVAFLCGISAVLLGRLAYFHLSKIAGLPKAFYELQGKGMALAALIVALTLIVMFGLSTRGRLQALALGCVLMHFGEAAVASTAPTLWSEMFSPEYVAAVSTGATAKG